MFNEQYVLEGLYFDAAFTKKITVDTPIPDGCDIYLKFDLGSLVVFETITGDSLYVCLPKSFKLDEVNWQSYIKESNLNGFENQLGELIYRSSSYSEFVTLSEFYADRELTKKVNEIGNLTHIYLGYKQHPIVNVICVDDCRHNHEPLINNQTGMLYKHEHYDDATSKQGYIEFYLDEECSIVFNHEMYNYATEDYSIYGKFVEKSVLYTIHCGCLNHPNGISNTFNSFYEATLECDYGYSHTGFAMEGFIWHIGKTFFHQQTHRSI